MRYHAYLQWVRMASRNFSRTAVINGMFRVPAHMTGDLERSTNNNIEHQSLEFSKYCLAPWLMKWQAELGYKLLPKAALGRNAGRKFFVKFDISDLIMGDFKTTFEAYAIGLVNGVYSVNDVLKKMNSNPIGPEGDIHTIQNQNITLEQIAAQADAAIKVAKNPPPPPPVLAPGEPAPGKPAAPAPKRDLSEFKLLFNDSFNRVITREKRDKKAVSGAFQAIVGTFAQAISAEAAVELNTNVLPEAENKAVVDDVLEQIAKRADSWNLQDGPDAEFDKVVRSLRISFFREMAISKAKE